jgi:hypothetical protein
MSAVVVKAAMIRARRICVEAYRTGVARRDLNYTPFEPR